MDSVSGGAVSAWIGAHVGSWNVPQMASQPGLLAFAMTIVLSVVCSIGVRESTMLNNALTAINLAVILFVICAGSRYANTDNFTPFAPFGVSGIFTGAATAFYSYVGFDVIATSAEEAKNPSRNIPIAIIASLCICMGFYMAVAAVITLMIPYAQIDTTAPLSQAFAHYGATWAKYIIDVGAICGLSTSLMVSARRGAAAGAPSVAATGQAASYTRPSVHPSFPSLSRPLLARRRASSPCPVSCTRSQTMACCRRGSGLCTPGSRPLSLPP